jgi:hypothetical protein
MLINGLMAGAANTNEWAHDRCCCNIFRWAHYEIKKKLPMGPFRLLYTFRL